MDTQALVRRADGIVLATGHWAAPQAGCEIVPLTAALAAALARAGETRRTGPDRWETTPPPPPDPAIAARDTSRAALLATARDVSKTPVQRLDALVAYVAGAG